MAESNAKFKCHYYHNHLQRKHAEIACVPQMFGKSVEGIWRSILSLAYLDLLDKRWSSAVRQRTPSLPGGGRQQAGRRIAWFWVSQAARRNSEKGKDRSDRLHEVFYDCSGNLWGNSILQSPSRTGTRSPTLSAEHANLYVGKLAIATALKPQRTINNPKLSNA